MSYANQAVRRDFNIQPFAIMLHYTITFLIISLIAAVLGFGGVAGTAAGLAKICFFVFLVLFIVSFFTGRRAV